MNDFLNYDEKDGFAMKLWRGERMCLLGFDVIQPEDDLVGFAIEFQEPGSDTFFPLKNRLAFSYDQPIAQAVTGARKFDSTLSPFQKFRWIHFPNDVQPGLYCYRATKMHMPLDVKLVSGTSIELPISLDPVTYNGFLDIGFTRNFASSQAYAERFNNAGNIIPSNADDGLTFKKLPGEMYTWLGFEAYELIFNFLKEVVEDETIQVDFFAYDLNEPDIVAQLELLGPRLRAIIDDTTKTAKSKAGVQVTTGHGTADSAETRSAALLIKSAGVGNVQRMHFFGLQHNKVLIAKRNGQAFKVLAGSTNFSFRGLYIQANNVLVFDSPEIADLFEEAFQNAFTSPSTFKSSSIAVDWHPLTLDGKPPISFCFSPHQSAHLSLDPMADAINKAGSSVLYAVAFLDQMRSGPTKEAFDLLIQKPIFSYGVADSEGGLKLKKPDGSIGLVDTAYLADHSPEPFKSEWSGGIGINVHHKFVVTDFNLATAVVFTGSSNLSMSGEEGNGDQLIKIEDRKIATSYAIEALRIFDHLHFRDTMKNALSENSNQPAAPSTLKLRKPTAISQQPAWFEEYYVAGSQKESDRKLFSAKEPLE